MAVNGILGNEVNRSPLAYNIIIYVTRNRRVVIRTLQRVTNKLDAWTIKRGLTFSTRKTVNTIFRKKNKEPIKSH